MTLVPIRFQAVAYAALPLLLMVAGDGGAAAQDQVFAQQAYLKASNTGPNDEFGYAVAISGDTAVVGARHEASNATGVNGAQDNNLSGSSGAAYVFVRGAAGWSQQAYLKASNTALADFFGSAVAISGDTIVVGAPNQGAGGAAYVFVRNGTAWSQQAFLKASNEDPFDSFGSSVAVSGDTIVVGAYAEDSAARGVNGDQASDLGLESGAAYVFVRSGTTWSQQAYLKSSNSDANDNFGFSVGVSGDTTVIGAFRESSNGTGESNNAASQAGAAYVFIRSGTTWSQQAYLKASNTGLGDIFGHSVAVSGDTVVVGAKNEASTATGVNGDQTINLVSAAGAAYVFVRDGDTWSQEAYLKASNTPQAGIGDQFGHAVAISRNVIVVGAIEEDSGTGGNQADNSVVGAGAAYVFVRSGGAWNQHSYLKASNPGFDDTFGNAVGVSGGTVVAGAPSESSSATGVNSGGGDDDSATRSGAAYLFELPNTAPTITVSSITRWPGTTGSFLIATVDDAEDGPDGLEVTIESANPSSGVTLSGLANAAGSVTADVVVDPDGSSASVLLRVTDVWGGFSEGTYDVTVVPPVSITPNISPAANSNDWHNEPVTVVWTVANSSSQSGCSTILLSVDTAVGGTTLTCTAANDGGSSSQSVTIRVDLTAPIGTASRTPLANANGWTNTDVTATFTCADALSGAVTTASSQTISSEGAGQSRAFLCLDVAGNAVPLSVEGVNIDKTAPVVVPASLAATPNPAPVSAAIALSANLTDTGSSGLAVAEFNLDAGSYSVLASVSGPSATATGPIGAFANPAVLNACVRASDLAGNQSAVECTLIAVFDPDGGSVAGAGTFLSPPGALVGSTATGTARFGFQSKYARGAAVPAGRTQFKFVAGDLEFDSTSYDWMVVAGARAKYKGVGTIRNRTGAFEFMLTAIDGDRPNGGGVDRFRIKISGPAGVIYDNEIGVGDGADPSTAIDSGHIVIRN